LSSFRRAGEIRITPEQLAELQVAIRQRLVSLFVRRGRLDKAESVAQVAG